VIYRQASLGHEFFDIPKAEPKNDGTSAPGDNNVGGEMPLLEQRSPARIHRLTLPGRSPYLLQHCPFEFS